MSELNCTLQGTAERLIKRMMAQFQAISWTWVHRKAKLLAQFRDDSQRFEARDRSKALQYDSNKSWENLFGNCL